MTGKLKESLVIFIEFSLKAPSLPFEPMLLKRADEVALRFSNPPRQPDSVELEPIYRRFMEALESENWEMISPREWRYAPYVFWYGDGDLIKESAFRQRYLAWLSAQKRTAWKRLIGAYLRDFLKHEKFPHIYRDLSKWIREGIERPDLAERLSVWRERQTSLEMFSNNFSTEKTVSAFVKICGSDMDRFTDHTGMGGILAQSDYMLAVARAVLRQLERSAESPRVIDTLLPFFDDGTTWRFPQLRTQLLEALLLPWSVNNPETDYKNRLQRLLLERSGDPRLLTVKQHKWLGVSDEAVAVMLRWLVGETIQQFFSVIDEMALEHQWRYRRAFWLAYYEKGYIDDAWVVFGKKSREYAVRSFGKKIGAGRIQSGIHSADHSVLILRIRDYVFADWSHNGKCRAWDRTDKNCPKLHRLEYQANELRTFSMKISPDLKDDGITHAGSENYRWQSRLAEFIRRHTGITMSQRDYHVI